MTYVTPKPDGISEQEWAANLSEPAAYSGEAPDRSRERTETGPDGEVLGRFREILLQVQDLEWREKTLAGLSHKPLWRNDETGASARAQIEKILGEMLASNRPTHTM